ncbi:DUF418 domain-containing protein [Novosphingobium sp. KACC 22771]|uniref:DUF418 domain-containing protein n=1 Tax=Novosphingobium sp. KACC 22771 TaxID=3025670 RepID=UPI0023663786|nr:DUF418 domain-containing protein [Novosphingobium sp. KACC 22771]WDF74097.1 DUF418 domain-containing protein [Novosphingobium sp. KACC 22771]
MAGRERIISLDLVRGFAVLGIVAVNVAGFAGPRLATLTPAHLIVAGGGFAYAPADPLDEAVFAAILVLFEGKMRALFTMLFGASMLLFIERAEAAGRNGLALQARRLGWLALFGYLHYVLLWWGDILFLYAACGYVALGLCVFSNRALMIGALAGFMLWAVMGALNGLPLVLAEEHMRLGIASAADTAILKPALADSMAMLRGDVAQAHLGFMAMAHDKLVHAPGWPFVMLFASFGETLPLMLIGMVLYRVGFAQGLASRRVLWGVAALGLALGLPMALGMAWWAWERHFPPVAMGELMANWAAPQHLLLALAYYALMLLAAPCLLRSGLGARMVAAGRMAFSNYILTSVALSVLFYRVGLFGRMGEGAQMLVVLTVWVAMLGWSKPWLGHFRQGPLEWLWRSLVERRALPFKRSAPGV